MRKLIITSLIGSSLLIGCATNKLPTTATTQEVKNALDTDLTKTVQVSRLVTGSYLLTISDKAERTKTSKIALDVLTKVNVFLEKGNITSEDVRTYVLQLLSTVDVKNRDSLLLLVDAVSTLVDENVTITLPTSGVDKTSLSLQYAKSALQGVEQGLHTYGQ